MTGMTLQQVFAWIESREPRARLVGDARTMGVVFTGSTEVARILQRTLAGRLDACHC